MMQEVIEKQGGYYHLDSEPRTLSGKAHRPAYGSDGDYWSKPNAETVFDAVYEMMNEVDPTSVSSDSLTTKSRGTYEKPLCSLVSPWLDD